ncbi:tumor necrosis factor [Stegastes partitus]|uniref:Tumor necrosis factor n=1 Tax=Stegastes partitus TaxID=144197 RepID=A0A9Y4KNP6_9TELE|nr:PREDICTED: tumor necrosis factor-like [Stegastes partitus]
MEEYDFYEVGGEEEARLHRQNTSIQLLIQKVARLYRMAQFIAVALLLLISGALALLITVGLGGRCHVSADQKATMITDSNSSGINSQRGTERFQANTNIKNPSAMLTAPRGGATDGEYLQWESVIPHAFCQGGFSYSNGSLVVPRSGYYRVFVQVTYESNGEQCPKPQMMLNNKVLYVPYSYNKNVTLLTSDDVVRCSTELWRKSLHTFGLFFLEANGRLRVTSTYPKFIARNEYQVFFGAELLSSQ